MGCDLYEFDLELCMHGVARRVRVSICFFFVISQFYDLAVSRDINSIVIATVAGIGEVFPTTISATWTMV